MIELVLKQRSNIPFLGGKKLYHLLKKEPEWASLKVGRDRLFSILRKNDLLVRRRKRYKLYTTDSKHWLKKYPNIIKDIVVNRSDQVWVCDITYIRVGTLFQYLFLITDVYSSKIMGFCLHPTMKTVGAISALEMALKERKDSSKQLIHHSDRGSQYCSYRYTSLLHQNNIQISMTEQGDPYENAKAERINGILKEEFKIALYQDESQAFEGVKEAVDIYNNKRPHLSCDYMTPQEAYQQTGKLKKHWKNYYQEKNQTTTKATSLRSSL